MKVLWFKVEKDGREALCFKDKKENKLTVKINGESKETETEELALEYIHEKLEKL